MSAKRLNASGWAAMPPGWVGRGSRQQHPQLHTLTAEVLVCQCPFIPGQTSAVFIPECSVGKTCAEMSV